MSSITVLRILRYSEAESRTKPKGLISTYLKIDSLTNKSNQTNTIAKQTTHNPPCIE